MPNEIFTDPESATERWASIRMTEPSEKEWDVDFVVAGGQVEYVDLRVRPELLTPFVARLLDDVDAETARTILSDVADRNEIDLLEEHDDD